VSPDSTPSAHPRVEPPRGFAGFRDHHEAMLRSGDVAVSVGVVGDLTVSYGVGEPEEAAYLRRVRADGIPTVRRSSGGRGIVHAPGDLVWALVLPRSDRRVGRDFVRAYARFGQGLVALLADRGATAQWVPAPGLSADYCPLSERGWVLEVDGQVLGAAAQHLTGRALLHHGTLPGSLDRPRIARWFDLPTPGPADRLTSLDELGIHDPAEALAHELARHLDAWVAAPAP